MAQIASGNLRKSLVEVDNLRAAWQWGVAQHNLETVMDMAEGLFWIYISQVWIQEGIDILDKAVTTFMMPEPHGMQGIVLGLVLAYKGIFTWHFNVWQGIRLLQNTFAMLHQLDAPKEVLARILDIITYTGLMPIPNTMQLNLQYVQTSIKVSRELNDQWRVAVGLNTLGYFDFSQGEYAKAQRYFEEALDINRKIGSQRGIAQTLIKLGNIASRLAKYEKAQQLLTESLVLLQKSRSNRYIPHVLWELGNVAWQQELISEAEQMFRESLVTARRFDYDALLFVPLSGLSLVAWQQGKYEEALQLAEDCLAKARGFGGPGAVTGALVTLGYFAVGTGDHKAAIGYYSEALKLAVETKFDFIAIEAVIGAANFEAKMGSPQQAVEWLALGLTSPWATNGGFERKPLYFRLREELKNVLGEQAFNAAWERGTQLDLDTTVVHLLDSFGGEQPSKSISANQTLVEPLTPRELEVLALLAEGRTNPEIAKALTVVVGTVKRHVHNISQKLNADNRTQAVLQAKQLGLIG